MMILILRNTINGLDKKKEPKQTLRLLYILLGYLINFKHSS